IQEFEAGQGARSGDYSTKAKREVYAGHRRSHGIPEGLVGVLPPCSIPRRPDPDGGVAAKKTALLSASAMQAGPHGGAFITPLGRASAAGGSFGLVRQGVVAYGSQSPGESGDVQGLVSTAGSH